MVIESHHFPSPLPPLPRLDMRELESRLHSIMLAHESFSSSSVLSNFFYLPSNQSEQPLLVYNEMFSRVLVSRRVSCEGSILEVTSS